MAVSTTNAMSGPYFTNGLTVTFPFTFTAPSAEEVDVVLIDGAGNETFLSGYTVTLGQDAGGSVTFSTPPASGYSLYVLLEPSFRQEIAFEDGSAWRADPVNEAYDRSAVRDQVLKRDIERGIKVPLGEAAPILPPAPQRAGSFLAFDAGGVPVPASGTGVDPALRQDIAAPTGARLIGFDPTTPTTPGTAAAKLQEIPSTQDYASEEQIEAAPRDWFFAPDGSDFEVSGTFAKRFFGPGNLRLPNGHVPGDQGGAQQGFSLFCPCSDEGQQFAFSSKTWVGERFDRGSAPGQNHIVSVYAETSRGDGGTAGVWAFNTVTNCLNLNGPTIGYEIDMNNMSGEDPGLNPTHVWHALSLINGAAGRGGTGLVIGRNGDYPDNEWNRGIHVTDVLQHGIEFTNCGQATGFFADHTMAFKALSDTPVMRLTPFNDANLTDALLYLTDSANSIPIARWNKRGEIAIGGVGAQGMNGVGVRQISNGDNALFVQRLTDSAPTGTFIRAVNAANNQELFDVDFNVIAGETNLRLSVGGAVASRVSVGAADSAGTGYRTLRVPN